MISMPEGYTIIGSRSTRLEHSVQIA